MLFNQKYIVFLSILYLASVFGFHSISIRVSPENCGFTTSRGLRQSLISKCLRPSFSSPNTPRFVCNNCQCNVPDISHGDSYSNTSYTKVLSSGDVLLPYLDDKDKMILAAGGMIQKQYRDGYRGSGLVVVDIKCSPDIVFDTLTQFAMYEHMIPIVKSSKIISSDGVSTVAEFALTKFLLRANVKHTVLPDERIVKFILDENQINLVVKEAEGYWHVEVPQDRPAGYCRVYLSAQVLTDTMVTPLILDYAVSRALYRATQWLNPFFMKR